MRKGNRKTVMGIVTMQMLMMDREKKKEEKKQKTEQPRNCLLYTSDAADE